MSAELKPKPLLEQRTPLDRARPFLTTVAILAALVGITTLIIEYGFAPDPAQYLALHIIEVVVLAALVAQLLVKIVLARPVRQYLRERWYHYALLVLFGAAMWLLRWLEVPDMQLWMMRTVQIYIVASLLLRLIEVNRQISVSRLRPAQILVGSFASLIIIGTGLLMLPAATAPDQPPTHLTSALFTATSAVCVTGLIVENTGAHWSMFGQLVILVLIQLGGLGLMTFGSVFAIMLWRGMGIRQTVLMRDVLSHNLLSEISRVVVFILLVTFCFEAAGTLLLMHLWDKPGMALGQRVYHSIFHAISGFCNAGLSLYADSFSSPSFQNAWQTLIVLGGLIICGGLGFIVLFSLARAGVFGLVGLIKRLFGRRPSPDFRRTRLGLQVKIVLTTTLILIVVGTALTFTFESLPQQGIPQEQSAGENPQASPNKSYSPMGQMPWHERLAASYFLSVTSRTAGFNTTDTSKLTLSTKFLAVVLMVIGASPGSTGGGIKTVTLAVILISIWSLARGRNQPQAFRRTIHRALVQRAMTVFALAIVMVSIITMTISAAGMKAGTQFTFLDVLFETTSAFGTVGLSTGRTGDLNSLGRLLIIITMFVGRLGPLTIFVALPTKEPAQNYDYPAESITIG